MAMKAPAILILKVGEAGGRMACVADAWIRVSVTASSPFVTQL
jgi:hypothetical protein